MHAVGRFGRRLYVAAVRLVRNEGLELSGYVAYTTILALFPFMIFLGALAGFVGSTRAAERFIDAMFTFMPPDVVEALAPAVRDVVAKRKGDLLTLGILGTLWVASSAVEALRTSLNRAYEVPEQRSMLWLRLQSLLFVVTGGLALLVVSFSVILGPLIWEFAVALTPLPQDWELGWVAARYGVGAAVLVAGLVALHCWLPNKRPSVRMVLPGAVLSAVLWLSLASLFTAYLGVAGDWSVTYGSLAGAMIALTFFYVSAVIFIIGAEFNATREGKGETTAHKTADIVP